MTQELVNVLKEASDHVFPVKTTKMKGTARPLPELVEMAVKKNNLRRLASAEAALGNKEQARQIQAGKCRKQPVHFTNNSGTKLRTR